MLTRRIVSLMIGSVLLLGFTASAAYAEDTGGGCSGPDCGVWGDTGGGTGSGGGSDDGGSSGGNGDQTCSWQGTEVPCDGGVLGQFNSGDGCYYDQVDAPSPDPHNGEGAWYWKTCMDPVQGTLVSGDAPVWFATPPTGPNPEELAQRALATIRLNGADIGMAPRPGTAGLVNLPVWMWTAVTPNTWGPISASASAGGLTVTITAKAEGIVWDMGDGHTVTCTSPGTPFTAGGGGRQSPTCGYTYLTPSRDRAGGAYTVTATTDWRVDWAGGGVTGVIDQTRTSQTTVAIDELQVVNR